MSLTGRSYLSKRLIQLAVLVCLLGLGSSCSENSSPVEIVKVFGLLGEEPGQFKYVEDFAVDRHGQILITDALKSTVQVFSSEGVFLNEFAGKGKDAGSLIKPEGIAIDQQGNIHVADYRSGYIKKYSALDYQHLLTYSGYGSEPGKTRQSEFMTFHPNGLLYVPEAGNDRVSVFSAQGEFKFSFGRSGSGPGQFNQPESIKHNSVGELFVSDLNNHRIQVFDETGKFLRSWGGRVTKQDNFVSLLVLL